MEARDSTWTGLESVAGEIWASRGESSHGLPGRRRGRVDEYWESNKKRRCTAIGLGGGRKDTQAVLFKTGVVELTGQSMW